MTGSLRQTAYERIRELLLSGTLPPGTHLSARALGRHFGMSLIPVREAIGQRREAAADSSLASLLGVGGALPGPAAISRPMPSLTSRSARTAGSGPATVSRSPCPLA